MLVLLHPLTTLCATELPGADRIFGAICWGLRAVAGPAELDGLLTACAAGDPPMLLSAGFPWVRLGNRRVELLPRPMLPTAPKSARYVSRQLWEQLVRPSTLAETLTGGDGRTLELGQVALAAVDVEGMPKLPGSVPIPRTTSVARRSVLRSAGGGVQSRSADGTEQSHLAGGAVQTRSTDGTASPVFERNELAFPAGVGWAFLLHLRRPEWRERLAGAIAWVCDTGWGAARSVGKGAARVTFEESPLPAEELSGVALSGSDSSAAASSGTAGSFISLSAWHPTPAERAVLSTKLTSGDAGPCEYGLTLRDGWAHPNRPVTLVREGSVLPWPGAGAEPTAVAGSCPRLLTAMGLTATGSAAENAAEATPDRPTATVRWGFAYPVAVRE